MFIYFRELTCHMSHESLEIGSKLKCLTKPLNKSKHCNLAIQFMQCLNSFKYSGPLDAVVYLSKYRSRASECLHPKLHRTDQTHASMLHAALTGCAPKKLIITYFLPSVRPQESHQASQAHEGMPLGCMLHRALQHS